MNVRPPHPRPITPYTIYPITVQFFAHWSSFARHSGQWSEYSRIDCLGPSINWDASFHDLHFPPYTLVGPKLLVTQYGFVQ